MREHDAEEVRPLALALHQHPRALAKIPPAPAAPAHIPSGETAGASSRPAGARSASPTRSFRRTATRRPGPDKSAGPTSPLPRPPESAPPRSHNGSCAQGRSRRSKWGVCLRRPGGRNGGLFSLAQTDVPPDRLAIHIQLPRHAVLAPAPLNHSDDGLLVHHASALGRIFASPRSLSPTTHPGPLKGLETT